MKASGHWFLGLAMIAGAVSCARNARPTCENPPPFFVTLEGADRLNPDSRGQSLTTQVEIVLLKSAIKVDGAEFNDAWQHAKDYFGEDLVADQTVTLNPGAKLTTGFARDPKANYVLVMGGFRQPSGTAWRELLTLPPPVPQRCGPEPLSPPPEPRKEDPNFHFLLEDFRVEQRGPA